MEMMIRHTIAEHTSSKDRTYDTDDSILVPDQRMSMEAIRESIEEEYEQLVKHYRCLAYYYELLEVPRDNSLYHEVDQSRRHGDLTLDVLEELIDKKRAEISDCEDRIRRLCASAKSRAEHGGRNSHDRALTDFIFVLVKSALINCIQILGLHIGRSSRICSAVGNEAHGSEDITSSNKAAKNFGARHVRIHIQTTGADFRQSDLAGNSYGIRFDCEMRNHAQKECHKHAEI